MATPKKSQPAKSKDEVVTAQPDAPASRTRRTDEERLAALKEEMAAIERKSAEREAKAAKDLVEKRTKLIERNAANQVKIDEITKRLVEMGAEPEPTSEEV
jgi:Tfp pilus assembly protein PilE